MKLAADPHKDLYAHVDRVNELCESIDYSKMTKENFKSLVFFNSLKDPEFNDICR